MGKKQTQKHVWLSKLTEYCTSTCYTLNVPEVQLPKRFPAEKEKHWRGTPQLPQKINGTHIFLETHARDSVQQLCMFIIDVWIAVFNRFSISWWKWGDISGKLWKTQSKWSCSCSFPFGRPHFPLLVGLPIFCSYITYMYGQLSVKVWEKEHRGRSCLYQEISNISFGWL